MLALQEYLPWKKTSVNFFSAISIQTYKGKQMSIDLSKATGTNEKQPVTSVIFKPLPDLPAPPQKFIDYMLSKWVAKDFPKENHSSYARRELKDWKGHSGPAARVQRGAMEGDLQAEFEQWAGENIGQNFISAGAGWLNVDPEVNPPSIGGHTDRTRSVAIGYCIKCGGPDADLTFWRERG